MTENAGPAKSEVAPSIDKDELQLVNDNCAHAGTHQAGMRLSSRIGNVFE